MPIADAPSMYMFAGLLVLAAVVLAFVPALRHVWTFAMSRRAFAGLLAGVVMLGVVAVVLVGLAVADPAYFLPIILVTIALRMSSPYLLYRGIRDRYEPRRGWWVARGLLAAGFLVLAGILVVNTAVVLGWQPPVLGAPQLEVSGFALLGEQIVMALGASILIVRAALRVRPQVTMGLWPLWFAAVLLALAFVVVLPYAVPAFVLYYSISGFIGWCVASALALRDR
jgi:hypothetical protein